MSNGPLSIRLGLWGAVFVFTGCLGKSAPDVEEGRELAELASNLLSVSESASLKFQPKQLTDLFTSKNPSLTELTSRSESVFIQDPSAKNLIIAAASSIRIALMMKMDFLETMITDSPFEGFLGDTVDSETGLSVNFSSTGSLNDYLWTYTIQGTLDLCNEEETNPSGCTIEVDINFSEINTGFGGGFATQTLEGTAMQWDAYTLSADGSFSAENMELTLNGEINLSVDVPIFQTIEYRFLTQEEVDEFWLNVPRANQNFLLQYSQKNVENPLRMVLPIQAEITGLGLTGVGKLTTIPLSTDMLDLKLFMDNFNIDVTEAVISDAQSNILLFDKKIKTDSADPISKDYLLPNLDYSSSKSQNILKSGLAVLEARAADGQYLAFESHVNVQFQTDSGLENKASITSFQLEDGKITSTATIENERSTFLASFQRVTDRKTHGFELTKGNGASISFGADEGGIITGVIRDKKGNKVGDISQNSSGTVANFVDETSIIITQ